MNPSFHMQKHLHLETIPTECTVTHTSQLLSAPSLEDVQRPPNSIVMTFEPTF